MGIGLGFGRAPGVQIGALRLQLDLRRYPLARLAPLIGSKLHGQLDAWGSISGSLQDLRPDLQLVMQAPGAGPVLLNETWSGALTARSGGGGDLRLLPPAPVHATQVPAREPVSFLITDAQHLQQMQAVPHVPAGLPLRPIVPRLAVQVRQGPCATMTLGQATGFTMSFR